MTDKLSPKPGAGVEALGALKQRRSSAPPPSMPRQPAVPAPTPTSQPAPNAPATNETPTQAKTATKNAAATKKTTSNKSAASKSATASKTVGSPTGNFRQIKVYLPTDLREALEKRVNSEGSTFGEVSMDAVRSHHQTIREEAATPTNDECRRRVPKGDKVATAMLITPEEAEALVRLSGDVNMSVTLVVVVCLQSYL